MMRERFSIAIILCSLCLTGSADSKAGLAFILSHNPLASMPQTKVNKGADLDVVNEATLYAMLLIRGYQLVLSPQTPPSCNFFPSCSQYAILAVKKYGFILGTLMASDRLQRCNGRSLDKYPVDPETGKRYDPLERNVP